MKSCYRLRAFELFLVFVAFVMVPGGLKAGPLIEFGDEGYIQLDLKLQGIADYADFGSGLKGDDNRWDLNLRRTRISLTGFLNDTWGAKFQT